MFQRGSSVLVLVLLVGGMNCAFGAEIVWVRELHFPDQDQEWVDFLTGNGHTVDGRDIQDLDDQTASELNDAQLVILTRDTNSGNYNSTPEEVANWNGITAPMIVMTPYVIRSSRWLMVNSTAIADTSGTLEAIVPDHPIFAGGVLDELNQVDMWDEEKFGPDDNIDLIDLADIGNGELIAKQPDSDLVWAAFWEEGTEYYEGSGQFAGGPRMFLSGGSDDDPNSWGGKNYTPEGDQILLNAIEFMAPSTLPGEPGDFNVDGVVDLTDFDIMASNFNEQFPRGESYVKGDLNLDTRVNLNDFMGFRNLFNPTPAETAAVPEPSSFVLLGLACLLLTASRRRRTLST